MSATESSANASAFVQAWQGAGQRCPGTHQTGPRRRNWRCGGGLEYHHPPHCCVGDWTAHSGGFRGSKPRSTGAVYSSRSAAMRPPLSIAFGSGRAGVGKSTLVANLAVALQRQGYRCLLWDANISAPTLHTLFGVDPLLRAADAYFGRVQPEEVPLELRPGLWLFAERATSSPEAEQLLARHSRSCCSGLPNACAQTLFCWISQPAGPSWSTWAAPRRR